MCIRDRINALDKNASSASGVAGVFVAFLMMSGGIVSIVTRNWSRGGNIAMVVLYGLAALIGYTSFGFFKDLIVWATWCLVCAVLAAISLLRPPVLQSNKNFSKAEAPIPAPVQREFTYTSKDMVRAEAMSSYVTPVSYTHLIPMLMPEVIYPRSQSVATQIQKCLCRVDRTKILYVLEDSLTLSHL